MKTLNNLKIYQVNLFIVILFTLCSCINPKSYENQAEIIKAMAGSIEIKYPDIKNLEAIELKELLEQKSDNLILVDTREIEQIKVSTIPGAIFKMQFEKMKENKEFLTGKNIVLFSTIGGASLEYAALLKNQNITVSNLTGGTLSWAQLGLDFDNQGVATKKLGIESEAWNILPKEYEGIVP